MKRPSAGELARAAALAAVALLACWSLTTPTGRTFAVLGAACGALAGAAVARTTVRTWVALLGCVAVGGLGLLAAELAVGPEGLPRAVGPLGARAVGEATLWLGLALAAAGGLRFLSARFRTLALAEAVALVAAVAARAAAHRDGMIHRPLALGDWAFSRGGDPVLLLVVLGGLAAVAVGALLLADTRGRRGRTDVAALVGAVAVVIALVRLSGGPEPREPAGLGLTGEPRDGQAQPSSAGGGTPSPGPSGPPGDGGTGQDQAAQDEAGGGSAGASGVDTSLPFRNEYSSEGGDAPVAVVLFRSDYAPPAGFYYFRQTAFSQFNGIRLVEATRPDVDRDVLDRFPPVRELLRDLPPEARTEVHTTVGLMVEHPRPFVLDAAQAVQPAPNADPLRFRRTYDALSSAPSSNYEKLLGQRPGRAEWTAAQRAHYTEFPRNDRRYAELAHEIVSGVAAERRDDPLARAIAVKLWLEKNGTYSRRSGHAEAADPTASFLFGDRVGYCVHFAHAAVFLMRSLGVPSRVAGGYAVEESRRGGGSSLLVRGADAHAWPEVNLEGAGWVVVDVSPERILDDPPPPADAALQRRLAERLRGDPGEGQLRKDEARGARGFGGAGAGWLVGALVLAAYGLKIWRAVAPAFAGSPIVYRLAYRAALDRLAEAGLVRGYGETRGGFAERVRMRVPSLEALTRLHLAPALGSRRELPPPGEGRRLLGEVGRELRLTVPGWRRWLGLLNPVSFLWTR